MFQQGFAFHFFKFLSRVIFLSIQVRKGSGPGHLDLDISASQKSGESRAGLIIMMARGMLSIVASLSHVYKRGKG